MSEDECCPDGKADCNFSDAHELTLVEEIMRTIDRYNKSNKLSPCPVCLRGTMLAVAALLHVQSDKVNPDLSGNADLEARFAEAAIGRLHDVIEAASSLSDPRKH